MYLGVVGGICKSYMEGLHEAPMACEGLYTYMHILVLFDEGLFHKAPIQRRLCKAPRDFEGLREASKRIEHFAKTHKKGVSYTDAYGHMYILVFFLTGMGNIHEISVGSFAKFHVQGGFTKTVCDLMQMGLCTPTYVHFGLSSYRYGECLKSPLCIGTSWSPTLMG